MLRASALAIGLPLLAARHGGAARRRGREQAGAAQAPAHERAAQRRARPRVTDASNRASRPL